MKIYVLTDETRKGPFTRAELRKQLLAGGVKRDDLAWHPGIAEWTPLSELASLSREGDEQKEEGEASAPTYVMPPVPEQHRKRRVYKVRSRPSRPFRDWLFRFLKVAR